MTDFFHGWRRKTGITALLLALVLMTGWLRSINRQDVFSFPWVFPTTILASLEQSLVCVNYDDRESAAQPSVRVTFPASDKPTLDLPFIEWSSRFWGVRRWAMRG